MEPRSEAREFAALVKNAVILSREAEGGVDDIADKPPPPGVEPGEQNKSVIRVRPGPMHPSHRVTAVLAAALALAAVVSTAAAVTIFMASVVIAFAAGLSWFGFFIALNQLILLRSVAVIAVDERLVTITRRGIGGVQSTRYERSAIASVHTIISRLATSDEASIFDLVFLVRRQSELSMPGAPTPPPVAVREVVLDGREKAQLDWVAATLRRTLEVPEPPPAWPSRPNAPRWPMSLIRRIKKGRLRDS